MGQYVRTSTFRTLHQRGETRQCLGLQWACAHGSVVLQRLVVYEMPIALPETVSQRSVGSGFEDRDRVSASIYHVMSLDRWVDAIQRIDSPEYIEILY